MQFGVQGSAEGDVTEGRLVVEGDAVTIFSLEEIKAQHAAKKMKKF